MQGRVAGEWLKLKIWHPGFGIWLETLSQGAARNGALEGWTWVGIGLVEGRRTGGDDVDQRTAVNGAAGLDDAES